MISMRKNCNVLHFPVNFRPIGHGLMDLDRLSFSSLTSSVLMLAAGLCGFGKPMCLKSAISS